MLVVAVRYRGAQTNVDSRARGSTIEIGTT